MTGAAGRKAGCLGFWARGSRAGKKSWPREEEEARPTPGLVGRKNIDRQGNFPLILIQSPGQKKLAGWGRNPASSVKGENGI